MTRADALADARLRANPDYELVLLDRLDAAQRELLAQADADADLYGVLRPRHADRLAPCAVSADTALLFLTLAEPAPLPGYVRARLGEEAGRTIARLVLDGVLELERDGAYVSGPEAGALLASPRAEAGSGRVGELSRAALRYAQELTHLPPDRLAHRLYAYGTLPLAPRLRRRLDGPAAVARATGLAPGGPARAALAAGWVEADGGDAQAHWRQWRAHAASGPHRVPGGGSWKLYVSPALDALPEAVAAVAGELAGARGAIAFKVGRDLRGVCRPDKLVAYFDRLDDLRAGAERVRERLAGCPAQGVPFTAAIGGDGLLSWGADPPSEPPSAPRTSWRLWVAERLAEQLAAARGRDADADADGREQLAPWQFALQRLQLSGVDTDSWVPASGMWPEALASA